MQREAFSALLGIVPHQDRSSRQSRDLGCFVRTVIRNHVDPHLHVGAVCTEQAFHTAGDARGLVMCGDHNGDMPWDSRCEPLPLHARHQRPDTQEQRAPPSRAASRSPPPGQAPPTECEAVLQTLTFLPGSWTRSDLVVRSNSFAGCAKNLKHTVHANEFKQSTCGGRQSA